MNSTLMSNKLGSDAKEPLAGRWAGTGEFKKQPALAWHYQGEGKFWRKFWFTGFRGLVVAVPTIMGMALGLWIDTLWPSAHSWFSILLPIGFSLGIISALFWNNLPPKA